MHLTQREEKALSGEFGEAYRIAYRVLLAIGRLTGGERLIPIKWAHVSGVSYLTIGEFGLDFLKKISSEGNTKFKVFTTVNPCGMDIENWDMLSIPADYAEKQFNIISCYQKLGIARSFTCVPFQSYRVPKRGTHIAWAESSAAVYANSILGLKTNRESAVSALASALTGKTVYSDLHIDGNRVPSKSVRVSLEKRKISGSLEFGILGYFAGKNIPGVIGISNIRKNSLKIDEAKALCAAIGTVGSSGMFVLDTKPKRNIETLEFTEAEREKTLAELSDSNSGEAIVFGCPQMTIEELYELARALDGKRFRKKCIVFCSSKVYDLARTRGYTNSIEAAGATFVRDACADFTPLISALGVDSVETDSCKGAHYMKRVHGVKIALRDTASIIRDGVA